MTGDPFVMADGRMDVEAVQDAHRRGRNGYCTGCGEDWPCGPSWAAERIKRLREHVTRPDRLAGRSGPDGANVDR